MRTTIDLNERLLKKLKRSAKEKKMTLSRYVESLLTMNHLSKKTKKKKEFQLLTIKGELIDKNIDLDRPSEIVIADDQECFKE